MSVGDHLQSETEGGLAGQRDVLVPGVAHYAYVGCPLQRHEQEIALLGGVVVMHSLDLVYY